MGVRDSVKFHVAIDGSGAIDRGDSVAYGVVAGTSPEVAGFHRDWMTLLNSYDLTHIRLADAMSFRGAFFDKRSEWGDEREQIRDELLEKAARTIVKYLGAGGAATAFDGLPTDKVFRYRKNLMFEAIVDVMLRKVPETYTLIFLCDDDQDVAVQFYKSFDRFKRRRQQSAPRLGGICFFDDEQMAQLQAADLVAYVLRKRQAGNSGPLTEILFSGELHEDHKVAVRFTLPREL